MCAHTCTTFKVNNNVVLINNEENQTYIIFKFKECGRYTNKKCLKFSPFSKLWGTTFYEHDELGPMV
jgi:hypothetical protein